MSSAIHYVHKTTDLPPGEHFCILKIESVTIPGDERSRTNPGHGYGEHTTTNLSCAVYTSRKAWEEDITAKANGQWGSESWVPCVIRVPTVTTSVTVNIITR